ncbi:4'-phosphopantetheinyl transferase family protein [Coxiella endosymbiont of Amblyomma nuttalli]|uniref:4'-phosphopantetheinyl transferase family protein n=1 Tax=Coxiella endosymbiont of Amblyomma nuttalli TaxID=2749996 RepID=UPI001FD04D1C|nr:4'-phosphopantetheinyl transferase superfamily protein [Coxiella endosymbiont of Amblyomma nuttalli]
MKIWNKVDQVPTLQKNEVHIWRVFLETWSADDIERGLNMLSSEEKARADRFLQAKHRKRFITSHTTLHAILTKYVLELWIPLRFRYNEYGKPYLVDNSALQFNLSHSHSIALYAVAWDQEVGIDIEYMRKDIHIDKIAERFFSMEESTDLRKLPAEEQLAEFYRLWTLKEAYVKVTGRGLSFLLNKFTTNVRFIKTDGLISSERRCEQAKSKSWNLCSIPVGEDYKAGLAVGKLIKIVHYFDWVTSRA